VVVKTGFADELRGGEASEGLEAPGEVVGVDEVATEKMRCNLLGGGSIGVQQTGGGAVGGVSLVTAWRRLNSVADNRVDEARRIVAR
jgi:hypothetical protein